MRKINFIIMYGCSTPNKTITKGGKAMKQKFNERAVFLISTVFFFVFNIIGILIFRNKIRLSINSLVATLMFIILLIRGILACFEKNDQLLFLSKHYVSKFYKYNRPTQQQLKDFYIKATIYFAILPFYLPIAVFSFKNIHTSWCLLLLFIPQFAIVGIEIRKMMIERKERKIKEAILEKEKEEQEKREELGYWK